MLYMIMEGEKPPKVQNRNPVYSEGFTLVEFLLALAITIILISLIFVAFSRFFGERQLDRSTQEVIELINEARSLTLSSRGASGGPAQYYLRLAIDPLNIIYILTSPGDAIVKTLRLDSSVKITNVTAPPVWFFYDIKFERITGEIVVSSPLPPYTITLQSTRSGALTTISPVIVVSSPLPPYTITLQSTRSGAQRVIRILKTGVVEAQ